MANEVEELFGEGGKTPKPRTVLLVVLLIAGLLLAVGGFACSPVPGALVILFVLSMVTKEIGRVESGYLSADALPGLAMVQRLTYGSLLIILLLFIIAGFLLVQGYYEAFWADYTQQFFEWLQPPPEPEAPQ